MQDLPSRVPPSATPGLDIMLTLTPTILYVLNKSEVQLVLKIQGENVVRNDFCSKMFVFIDTFVLRTRTICLRSRPVLSR